MSEIPPTSVVILHPSRLLSEALAAFTATVPLKLEYILTDIDDIPIKKISGSPLFIVGGRTPGQLVDNVSHIKKCLYYSRIVAVGRTCDPHVVLMALKAGAVGYLHEDMTAETLTTALKLVLNDTTVLPLAAIEGLLVGGTAPIELGSEDNEVALEQIAPSQCAPFVQKLYLSTQEVAILRSLIDGASNKVIAQNLHIAEAKVKVHVAAVLRKIRVKNRTQAAIWVLKKPSLCRQLTNLDCKYDSPKPSPLAITPGIKWC